MCPFAARASAEPCFVPGLLRGPRIGGEAPLLASRDGGRACDVVVVCAAKKSNWQRGKGVVRAGPCGGEPPAGRASEGGGLGAHTGSQVEPARQADLGSCQASGQTGGWGRQGGLELGWWRQSHVALLWQA